MSTNAIRVPIVVDASTGEASVKKFAATTKTEIARAGSTATRSLDKIETKTKSVGNRFRGAEGAISGMGASLQLMGTQGPPAIQTITTSLVSMLAMGVTPLSVALAGGAGLISLIAAFGDESDEAAGKLDPLIRRGTELSGVLDGLAKRVQKLRLADRAESLGLSVDRAGLIEDRAAAQRRVRGPAAELARINRRLPQIPREIRELERTREGEALGELRAKLDRENARLRERMVVIGTQLSRDLGIIESVNEILASIERTERERPDATQRAVDQAASRLLSGSGRGGGRGRGVSGPSLLPDPFAPVDFRGGALDSMRGAGFGDKPDRQALFELEKVKERRDLEAQILVMMREWRVERAAADQQAIQDRRTANVAELEALEQRRRLEIESEERRNMVRAESFAGGLSGAVSQALASTDLSAFGQNLASVVQNSVAGALADAFIESTGIKDAAASAFGGLRGAFGLGPTATGN